MKLYIIKDNFLIEEYILAKDIKDAIKIYENKIKDDCRQEIIEIKYIDKKIIVGDENE